LAPALRSTGSAAFAPVDKLATNPVSIGSAPVLNTIGVVVLAALAASVAATLNGVTITAARRRTKSTQPTALSDFHAVLKEERWSPNSIQLVIGILCLAIGAAWLGGFPGFLIAVGFILIAGIALKH